MKNTLRAAVALLFLALPGLSRADVSTDVQALVAQADTLHGQLAATQVTAEALCAPLVTANQGARALVDALTAFNDGLAAPITLDEELLTGLADLALLNGRMGDEALRLGGDVQLLAPGLDALVLKDGLTAMLQLADDIGAMADRIGEMADKILVMADNIGLMADRIIETQEIQSQNLALTQNTLLQTQTTMLGLVSVVETATYDLDLNTLVARGELLAAELTAMVLNPLTIKYQLAEAAADVAEFKGQVLAMAARLKADSVTSTMVVADSTLLATTNMAIMATSLATVLDGYNLVIESLQAVISSRNLEPSLTSMLAMAADIGVMADAILEMADLILVMADNIGLVADQIIVTQQLQGSYLAISQASILATQEMAIGLIVARSL
jgi:hypothetical protein